MPDDAIVIYPRDLVLEWFGHDHLGSTRNALLRVGYHVESGWDVEGVEKALAERDPELVERWRLRKLHKATEE